MQALLMGAEETYGGSSPWGLLEFRTDEELAEMLVDTIEHTGPWLPEHGEISAERALDLAHAIGEELLRRHRR